MFHPLIFGSIVIVNRGLPVQVFPKQPRNRATAAPRKRSEFEFGTWDSKMESKTGKYPIQSPYLHVVFEGSPFRSHRCSPTPRSPSARGCSGVGHFPSSGCGGADAPTSLTEDPGAGDPTEARRKVPGWRKAKANPTRGLKEPHGGRGDSGVLARFLRSWPD